MHVVIIEKEWIEAQQMERELQEVFPGFKITVFTEMPKYLLAYRDLPAIDLLITEDRFLLRHPREDSEEYDAKLLQLFPDIIKDWDGKYALRKFLEYMRSEGQRMPVIIYTHSFKERMDERVFSIPDVVYCGKDLNWDNLIELMRPLLSVVK